ncbi:MAG: helix-turn-helix domain-containing protein [Thermodesulfobacteriota bacterium]
MDLLPASVVADRLSRDPSTVRRWCRDGILPGALRVGRDWVVPAQSLEHWTPPTARGRRLRLPEREILAGLARRYLWWKDPEHSLSDPWSILAQAMELGTWEDIARLERKAGRATLRDVLRRAPAGAFSPRSWHFWHIRLGLARLPGQVQPPPRRAFLSEQESAP